MAHRKEASVLARCEQLRAHKVRDNWTRTPTHASGGSTAGPSADKVSENAILSPASSLNFADRPLAAETNPTSLRNAKMFAPDSILHPSWPTFLISGELLP